MILVVKLIKAGDRGPKLKEMIPAESGLRNIKIPAKQVNCLYKFQMLLFIKSFEVWQRIFKLLK